MQPTPPAFFIGRGLKTLCIPASSLWGDSDSLLSTFCRVGSGTCTWGSYPPCSWPWHNRRSIPILHRCPWMLCSTSWHHRSPHHSWGHRNGSWCGPQGWREPTSPYRLDWHGSYLGNRQSPPSRYRRDLPFSSSLSSKGLVLCHRSFLFNNCFLPFNYNIPQTWRNL